MVELGGIVITPIEQVKMPHEALVTECLSGLTHWMSTPHIGFFLPQSK